MKIKDIINEVAIDTYSVPSVYKKLGQNSQLVRPTIYKHTNDIGDYYVHARPGRMEPIDRQGSTVDTARATEPTTEPAQGQIVNPEDPTPDATKVDKKETPSDKPKKPIRQNVPKLLSVTTKSGIKLSKHNDGLWRTPEGQVLDDPDLINALEKMSIAQRQTSQMAPGYQPMPATTTKSRRRR